MLVADDGHWKLACVASGGTVHASEWRFSEHYFVGLAVEVKGILKGGYGGSSMW